jgi:glucokinase
LETLVSEPAIVRLAEELASRDEQSILAKNLRSSEGTLLERVFHAAREGDELCSRMLQERARWAGIALANLVNTLNPELIVLGGLFAQAADLLLPTIEETVRRCSFANLGESVRLQITGFGRDIGLVGACTLALNSFFYGQQECA